jgi:hypothetical protein
MIKELIKLANDLDEAGKSGWADKVDNILKSLESEDLKTSEQIASKMKETAPSGVRPRHGSTLGSPIILVGYSGNKDGIPGNAGDTTQKSREATQRAIDALGLSKKVTISGVEQEEISGNVLGIVGDSEPPQPKPAAYQVDIVSLEFAE